MFSTVLSATLDGLHVEFVHVEVDASNGLPVFHMVGYLSSEVKEAGERVKTAIQNTGITLPPKKLIINLAPATVKKRGAAFDLPIAAAILESFGYLEVNVLKDVLIIGELGLNGEILPVQGVLPILIEANKQGYQTCIIPYGNQKEGTSVAGMEVIGVKNLSEVIEYAQNPDAFKKNHRAFITKEKLKLKPKSRVLKSLDFYDIQGQEMVKRAAEVAVAGQHNILLVGTPGASKTMIAERIPTILPPLSLEESMEISKIYSVMGLLEDKQPLITTRPFRQVHHTTTKTALVGGGTIPSPGEISLANGGVLMMDELAEFPKNVLEVLRQPLENHVIQIIRARGTYQFPADFLLVAAMNPCPCGYYPDYNRCTCTQSAVDAYLGKISKPFLSRIDICVEAPRVEFIDLKNGRRGEHSAEIRKRVCAAREVQRERYRGLEFSTNGRIPASEIETYCAIDKRCEEMMRIAYDKLNLTARTYHKTLRVARTIADLDGKEHITTEHLSEALSYRTMNEKYWGN